MQESIVETMKKEAVRIQQCYGTAGDKAESVRIAEALMKYQMNQFPFPNGSGKKASALYRVTSRLNHSCNPNLKVGVISDGRVSGEWSSDDGRILACAISEIEAGDVIS